MRRSPLAGFRATRSSTFVLLALLAAFPPTTTAADAVAAARGALAGDDADAKRAAVRALSDRTAATDDDAYALLVQAVGDRQTHDTAIAALRARTGLKPEPGYDAGGYPDYPRQDTAASWNEWLAARQADRAKDKRIEHVLQEAEQAKRAQATTDGPPSATPAAQTARTPDDDAAIATGDAERGELDRIVFKDGDMLICYVLERRLADDGTLVSVRVAHRDAAGTETIDGALIARIIDDAR